ncbi:hypothetical protein, partial [Ruminococcus callidus]|uniref:hypothetical protein n=1 Tax=Ruminococcus callidus TaxID=40519 RepID=UPI0026EE2D7B
ADLNLIILWRLFFSTHSFKLFEPPVKLGVFIVQECKGLFEVPCFFQLALFVGTYPKKLAFLRKIHLPPEISEHKKTA